ncbi:MAG: septum formation initiator family protein [Oceanicaulis sp.]
MNALKRFIPLVGFLLVIAFLGAHALTGEQGLRNRMALDADLAASRAELERLRGVRLQMEDRVARLDENGEGVDVDYLEERARAVLRFAHPDEIVVTIDRSGAR